MWFPVVQSRARDGEAAEDQGVNVSPAHNVNVLP